MDMGLLYPDPPAHMYHSTVTATPEQSLEYRAGAAPVTRHTITAKESPHLSHEQHAHQHHTVLLLDITATVTTNRKHHLPPTTCRFGATLPQQKLMHLMCQQQLRRHPQTTATDTAPSHTPNCMYNTQSTCIKRQHSMPALANLITCCCRAHYAITASAVRRTTMPSRSTQQLLSDSNHTSPPSGSSDGNPAYLRFLPVRPPAHVPQVEVPHSTSRRPACMGPPKPWAIA